jgi:hypothetical protein
MRLVVGWWGGCGSLKSVKIAAAVLAAGRCKKDGDGEAKSRPSRVTNVLEGNNGEGHRALLKGYMKL